MNIAELNKRMDSIMKDVPDSEFDKLCILEDIGGVSRERLMLHSEDVISDGTSARVLDCARRRATGYPLQYILGSWEFYGLKFSVGEGVLIPRSDTETLVDTALERLEKLYSGEKMHIIDLCSGSGCIAVSLAKKLADKAQVYGVELSGEAFPYLAENVRNNGVDVKLLRGDVMNGMLLDNFRSEETGEYIPVDCIVSNPPYLTDDEMESLQKEVTFEPEAALYGGNDGLKFYRVIACLWKELIRDGGMLIFEVGDAQWEQVSKILEDNGFSDIFTARDGADCVRVVGGYKYNG